MRLKSSLFFIVLALLITTLTSCKKNNINPTPSPTQSSFLINYGGQASDGIHAIKPLSDGNFIAVGSTRSRDYNAADNIDFRANHGDEDILVLKLDSNGHVIKQALLGGNGQEEATSLVIDQQNNIFITGYSLSSDNGFANKGGADVFVAKLNANDLSITKLQTLGGSDYDEAYSIKIDKNGNLLVAGWSKSSDNGFTNKGGSDVFIAQLNPDDLGVKKLQTFGGNYNDVLAVLNLDQNDSIFIAGWSTSTDNGFTSKGGMDAFVAKLNTNNLSISKLATFGGNAYDVVADLTFNQNGNVLVAGWSESTDNGFANKGGRGAFVAKLNADLSINQLQTLGGSIGKTTEAEALTVDQNGNILIVGGSTSTDDGFTNKGGTDAFVAKLNADFVDQPIIKTIGGTKDDKFASLFITTEGKIIAAGYSQSQNGDIKKNFGDYDALFFKTAF